MIIAVIIALLSCESESQKKVLSKKSVDKMSIQEKSWELDSLIFDYLDNYTSNQKYEFWINKWNEALNNQEFNEQQKNVIQVLIDSLKVNFFEENDKAKADLDNFEEMWNQMSLHVEFDNNQKRYLVAAIGSGLDDDPYEPSMGDCECSQQSDYCWWWGECSISCSLGGNRGCGFFFRHPCDGVCN